MTFRNPITSLSANQITPGTLPDGVLLPPGQVLPGNLGPDVYARRVVAGAIDGMTITGALVRSAAAGQRVELRTAGLLWRDDDMTYGYVNQGNPAGLNPYIELESTGEGAAAGGAAASLRLTGSTALASAQPPSIAMSAARVFITAPDGLWLNGSKLAPANQGAVVVATTAGATFGSTGGTLGVTNSVSYTAPGGAGDIIVTAYAAGLHGAGGLIDYQLRMNGSEVRRGRVTGPNLSAFLSHSVRVSPGATVSFQLVAIATAAASVTADTRFCYLILTATPA